MNLRHRTFGTLLALSFAATVPLVATATIAGATPGITTVRTAAPTIDQLNAKLNLAIDTSASRSARAAELESGEAGVATLDKVADVISKAPPTMHWGLTSAQQSGDGIDANLLLTTPGYPDFNYPLHWIRVGDSWKLSQDSVCTIGAAAGTSC